MSVGLGLSNDHRGNQSAGHSIIQSEGARGSWNVLRVIQSEPPIFEGTFPFCPLGGPLANELDDEGAANDSHSPPGIGSIHWRTSTDGPIFATR